MAVEFGKNLLPFLGVTGVGASKGTAVSETQAPKAFRTASYASIPYERQPQVTDTVPTKDAAGNPLLANYITPEKVWIA